MAVLNLTEERRLAFASLAQDLQTIFGARFVALVAYGPRASVVFASSITLADLAGAARHADAWRAADLAVPLILTPDEFRRSLDAFPMEYGAILHSHRVIAGTPPFDDAVVADADLRRGLEVLAKGHVLHLRSGAIGTGGRALEGRELIIASIDPFRALLANLARLDGAPANTDEDLAAHASSALGLPVEKLRSLLSIEEDSDFDPSGVMPVCLDAAERLWRALDEWKARAR